MSIETTEVPAGVAQTALGFRNRVEDLDKQIKQFSELATEDDYKLVAEYGLKAAAIVKEAKEFYEEEVGKLYSLWKTKTEERGGIVNPAEEIKNLAARLCAEWQKKKEDERRQEELRLQEEEQKRAEDAVLDEAAALQREGRTEEAEELISAPVTVAPVAVPKSVPRVNGVSKPRDNFKAEVTSLLLLVKAVAEGKVPINAVQANDSFLNNQARAMKGVLNYPGVKVKNEAKSSFKG